MTPPRSATPARSPTPPRSSAPPWPQRASSPAEELDLGFTPASGSAALPSLAGPTANLPLLTDPPSARPPEVHLQFDLEDAPESTSSRQRPTTPSRAPMGRAPTPSTELELIMPDQSDAPEGIAEMLEGLARRLRSGELDVAAWREGMSTESALAALLAELLGRRR